MYLPICFSVHKDSPKGGILSDWGGLVGGNVFEPGLEKGVVD